MKWHRAGGTIEVEDRREVVAVINPNGIRYFARYAKHLPGSTIWVLGRHQQESDLIARGWQIIKENTRP